MHLVGFYYKNMPVLLHFLYENLDYQMLINKITKINLIYKPHFLPDICYYSHNVFPKCLLLSRKYFTIEQIYLQIMPVITAVRHRGNGGIRPLILSLCTRWVKYQLFIPTASGK